MNETLKKFKELGNCFEFMPGSDGTHFQEELPPLLLKHPIYDSVTFFGGTFNPFHQGHRACLDLCPEKNILIVPDRNPFKVAQINEEETYQQFMAMAEMLKDTPYSLYPGFLASTDHNPTSSWLPHVKVAEKNFLMGDDSYMGLMSWIKPEEIIASLSKLYVVPRSYSMNDYELQEHAIKKWNPALDIIYLAEHPYKKLSSTDLRKTR